MDGETTFNLKNDSMTKTMIACPAERPVCGIKNGLVSWVCLVVGKESNEHQPHKVSSK